MVRRLIFAALVFGSCSSFAGNFEDFGDGVKRIFDGPVECITVDFYKGASLQCFGVVPQSLAVNTIIEKDSWIGPAFYKKVVGNRLCYVYQTYQSSGLSCVDIEGRN